MEYHKLVRDFIPKIIQEKGEHPLYHKAADEQEYWMKLKEKLQEEVKEFLESETIDEVADILEVIEAICLYRNFDKDEVARVKEEKRKKRGGFQERIILDES